MTSLSLIHLDVYKRQDVGSTDGFTYPARAYELAGIKNVRWPGDPKGLDENAPYQFIEYATCLLYTSSGRKAPYTITF